MVGSFTKKKGICQDLACLAAAMFRSQGIPAAYVVGRADGVLHAWVKIYFSDKEMYYDPTVVVAKRKPVKKYEVEKWY